MLLDRLKRKAQRLSTSKTSLGQNKEKEKNKRDAKERQVRKIKEKQEEIQKTPAANARINDKKRRAVVAPLVLRAPQITEKAVVLQDLNQYVFKVADNASKPEVRKAIEEVYGVDVLKVRMINIPAKRKRLGRSLGWQGGYRKAMVTVKKGQNIEILPR